jgi:hypothetical protein
MRQLKLRAYDKTEKRYVSIDSIQFDHLGGGEPFTLTTGGKTWAISRFVLERWAGLKDLAGRDIFEGDIIKVEYRNGDEPDFFAVGFNEEDASFSFENWVFQDQWEIAGNVNENPQLLNASI